MSELCLGNIGIGFLKVPLSYKGSQGQPVFHFLRSKPIGPKQWGPGSTTVDTEPENQLQEKHVCGINCIARIALQELHLK